MCWDIFCFKIKCNSNCNCNCNCNILSDSSVIMTVNLNGLSNSLLRFLGYTNFSIGYITNNKFKKIKKTGSFLIIINSENKNGPNAIYCISKSDELKPGKIQELVRSDGLSNKDILDLVWNPNEYPFLRIKLRLDDYKEVNNINFYVKVITSLDYN